MVKLAIAGGNIAGSTVMSMMRGDSDIALVGVFETDTETPGAVLAQKWGIRLFDDITALASSAKPEIIINVTGDTGLSEKVRALEPHIEVIDAFGARFLWKTLEKHKKAVIELRKTMEDEKKILSITENVSLSENFDEFMGFVLDKAMEVTDSPAGSIAISEGDEMHLLVTKGLSKRFSENRNWKIMPGGLTDKVLRTREIAAIFDISSVNYINNPALFREGITAMLACPILFNGNIRGILYLDDFKARQFSERQKRAIGLISRIIGLIFERMNLLKSLKGREEELAHLQEQFDKRVKDRIEELEKVNKELERASQHKSRFIANMSHELRTPLNSIIGFSDVLLEKTFGELTQNQDRYVHNIHSSGRHLLELVNNVLDIAKIEAGKYEMTYETFPVVDMMSEIFTVMKPMADKKTIALKLSIGDDVDTITADMVKLKQVCYNMLSNAIKFTPEGGKVCVTVERKIGRGEQEHQQFITFSVSDTGVGISADALERIFDEFEQADSTFSKEYGGAGLGLALTRKLVELHGGLITVESKLGEGSTFTVSLPVISDMHEKPADEIEAVNLNFPWMNEKAPLILVVEDDPASAELLTIHLTLSGYKVAHAFDGEEAIQKAVSLRPFAILLDIMLPKKDGWEVLQTFKSNEFTSHIPVLIHSIIDNKDLAFALGATDYLLKPLDKDALLKKLQGLSTLRGRKYPTTILAIDANGDCDSLKKALNPQEFLVSSAREGKRGIELATAMRPDVVLLDFELPDMLGFDVVKELKENPSTKNIPIFILTEKNISVEGRLSLMGKIERIIRKHKFDVKELIDHITDIEVLYPSRAGLVDELTGIFSHRYFHLRLAQEIERASRYKQPLNLMLLDVDLFGRYLRENGEQNGNSVLKTISELLTKNIRGSDVVVRYGGDAFAVVLPNTVPSAALSLGNRFNAIIRNYPFPHKETQPKARITASVGMAFLDGQTPEELIMCCEKALAQAVKKGGDRVEMYSQEWEEERQAFPGIMDSQS
ncbi:MAG TPA: response regulator [Thermodesulfovibrionales bacterium]|nr:response regulator [Thermodesulfovibrionales bacterium]